MLRAVPAKTEPDDEFMSGSAPTTHPPSSPDVNAKAVPVYPATGPGDEKKRVMLSLLPIAGVDPVTKKFCFETAGRS